jgi:hypothetical protein
MPIESMNFEWLIVYGLFPAVLVLATVLSALFLQRRQFVFSLLGTAPVFIGLVFLLRYSILVLFIHFVGYLILCGLVVGVVAWMTRRLEHRGSM